MAEPKDTAPALTLTDPKTVAAALASNGRLVGTHLTDTGRLAFELTDIPADFIARLVNDEVQVSARAFIASMEAVMGMIAEHQRRRR
jgi:hypothetical protein